MRRTTDGGGYSMPWFKLYSPGILRGTISYTMTPTQKWIWVGLLAMASESRVRGVICSNVNQAYPRPWIAQQLGVTLDELNATLDICLSDVSDGTARITIDEFGCIHINNFMAKYNKPNEKALHETPEQKHLRELREYNRLQQKLGKLKNQSVDVDTGEIVSEIPPATSA